MRVVLLLDFDGVIVDSPAHFRDATCDVANRILFFLPGRCDLLDNLYERYVKHKGTRGEPGVLGRVVGFLFYPILKMWNDALARHSKVLPSVEETLHALRKKGVTIILFSSQDWISNYKEKRFRQTGLQKYFDDVVSFRDWRERRKLLGELLERYSDAVFVWVDDRPHRFKGNVNGRIIPVWFQFPTTAEWEKEVAEEIPRLKRAKNWKDVFDIVRDLL